MWADPATAEFSGQQRRLKFSKIKPGTSDVIGLSWKEHTQLFRIALHESDRSLTDLRMEASL
jgi:hypothetical protein